MKRPTVTEERVRALKALDRFARQAESAGNQALAAKLIEQAARLSPPEPRHD